MTIEDVLEQIVGEIEDEYDTEDEPNIRQLNDQTYLVKAQTLIEEFNQMLKDQLSDEEYDTIGGLSHATTRLFAEARGCYSAGPLQNKNFRS